MSDTGEDPRLPRSPARSQDPRAQRTRERLVEAYVGLAPSSAALPNVSEVVAAAGVNRSSFYAHFTDVADLSLFVLETALAAVYEGSATRLSAGARSDLASTTGTMIIAAVSANAVALRAAVHHDRALARRQIGLAIERSTLKLLRSVPGWEHSEREPLRPLIIYLSHGWAGVICAWLAGELDLDEDQLLRELLRLNPDGVRYLQATARPAGADPTGR